MQRRQRGGHECAHISQHSYPFFPRPAAGAPCARPPACHPCLPCPRPHSSIPFALPPARGAFHPPTRRPAAPLPHAYPSLPLLSPPLDAAAALITQRMPPPGPALQGDVHPLPPCPIWAPSYPFWRARPGSRAPPRFIHCLLSSVGAVRPCGPDTQIGAQAWAQRWARGTNECWHFHRGSVHGHMLNSVQPAGFRLSQTVSISPARRVRKPRPPAERDATHPKGRRSASPRPRHNFIPRSPRTSSLLARPRTEGKRARAPRGRGTPARQP